jgi:hypothetical protein
MNKNTHVNTWEDCEKRLLQIEEDNSKSLTGVWFRGLSNACWHLSTTLERHTSNTYSVGDYCDLILRIKPQVESLTGVTWKVPEWSEPNWPFEEYFRKTLMSGGYIAHLRHHGFPSPLLDWSRSPYVAAYFAFAKREAADDVAIYAFSETPNNMKSSAGGGPKICSHGGYDLKTHYRHFRQQSSYTVCVERSDNPTQRWKFVSHQRVFESSDTDQDFLYKTTLPASERTKVLKCLDRYNLNRFSLFGSEEALMDTLAFREIDLKETRLKAPPSEPAG